MDAKTFQISREANLDVMIKGVDELKTHGTFDQLEYDLSKDDLALFASYDPVAAQVKADYYGGLDRSGLSTQSGSQGQKGDMTQANAQAVAQAAQAARAAQMEM